MSRREERRALSDELQERKEVVDGQLAQAPDLELPPPPVRRAPSPARTKPVPPPPAPVSPALAALEAQRPAAPSEDEDDEDIELPPPPAPAPKPARAAPPPEPEILPTPSPKKTMSKDTTSPQNGAGLRYSAEQPYEKMAEHIESGVGPLVYAEVRRLLPNGGTSIIKRNIQLPIMAWNLLGERFSTLLAGGGSFIIMLSADRGEKAFISWKEIYEGNPRAVAPGITLVYNSDQQEFVTAQNGLAEMGGVIAAPSTIPHNPYAASLPPMPGGPSAPAFPRPQQDAAGRLMPPPEAYVAPWARGFSAEQQWTLAREKYRNDHGISPDSGVGVARDWVTAQGRDIEQARTQAARYEERLDANRDRTQAMLDTERMARANTEKQVAELKQQLIARDQAAAAEKRETEIRNEMKLMALRIEQGTGGAGGQGTAQMVALATALAPVAAAFVTAQQERAAAEQRSRDEFQRSMMLAMQQKDKGPDFVQILAAVSPIAAPLLLRWMENQDPEKLAAARIDQKQSDIMLYKFIFETMAQMQPQNEGEPEPFWMRFMKELAPSAMGIGQAIFASLAERSDQNMRELPRMPQTTGPMPAPQPGQTQVMRPEDSPVEAVAPQPAPTSSYALDIAATVQRFSELDAPAAQLLGLILHRLSQEPGAEAFISHEWAAILFHLHVQPMAGNQQDFEERAEHAAVLLVDHLEHCRTFALIPQQIADAFSAPEAAIMRIIPALPVWQINEPFAKRVVSLFVEEITMREKDRLEAESGEEPEEEVEEEDGASGETEVESSAMVRA